MSPIMPDHPYSNESLRIMITQIRNENATLRAVNETLMIINQDLVEQFNRNVNSARENEETLLRIHNEQQVKIYGLRKEIANLEVEEKKLKKDIIQLNKSEVVYESIISGLRTEIKNLNEMIETLCRKEMEERIKGESQQNPITITQPDEQSQQHPTSSNQRTLTKFDIVAKPKNQTPK